MTKSEINAALETIGFDKDAWLGAMKPWEVIGTIVVDSTFNIYLNPSNDYRFNSTDEVLEIGIENNGVIHVKRIIPYKNIKAFNGTYIIHRGVPHIKGFR